MTEEQARTELAALNGCRYFLLCDRPADGVVMHPTLGDVPTCRRCANKLGLDLHYDERCPKCGAIVRSMDGYDGMKRHYMADHDTEGN